MEIIEVQMGDTLDALSRKYDLSLETIRAANGIRGNCLVPGEALLLPKAAVHIVQQGETLRSIAHTYGIPIPLWIKGNALSHPERLHAGDRLTIPERPKFRADINAYVAPAYIERHVLLLQEARPALSMLSLLGGRLESETGIVFPDDAMVRSYARQAGILPMLVIHNDDRGRFSQSLAHAFLHDRAWQMRLLDALVRAQEERGYGAVQFDLEHVHPDDRDAYSEFLKFAVPRLNRAGLLVSTALPPRTEGTPDRDGYDYAVHGALANFVVLMTYEWGWAGGPPLPIAPLPEVKKVLAYALTVIPRHKIMLGAPLYGYDWTLPYQKGVPPARVLGVREAVDVACRSGATIQFDDEAKAPFFRYIDHRGQGHMVWFEDVRALWAKIRLVEQYRLRGLSLWQLARSYPAAWELIRWRLA